MLRLISDCELRQRVSSCAREAVEKRFSWRSIAARFEEPIAVHGEI
jgi:glycosyltransferase involved in cell wall biosynthesis